MQKISSYLYPNRVPVVADMAAFTVEYNIVYQRPVKIYKGIDNVLEFDVKNNEQKRLDISTYNIKFNLLDIDNQEIYSTTADVSTGIKGIAQVTVPSSSLTFMEPQFLKYALYILNDDNTKTVLYGDTEFGASGTIHLLDGVLPETTATRIINSFNMITELIDNVNTDTWYSESAEGSQPNLFQEDIDVSLEFRLLSLEGTITVQFTEDYVVGHDTNWVDVETFSVLTSSSIVTKSYTAEDYNTSNNIRWIRIKYVRADGNSGSIDKVLIRV